MTLGVTTTAPTSFVLLRSLSTSSGFVSGSVWGHCSFGKRKNSGPVCHLPDKSETAMPRETSSATFCSPGICFHWAGSLLLWISFTLLDTNGLYLLAVLRIHANTMAVSVNRKVCSNWKRHSSFIETCNREAKTAACSYSRRIVSSLRAATLDLAATNLTSSSSFIVIPLIYANAPKAPWDASAKIQRVGRCSAG